MKKIIYMLSVIMILAVLTGSISTASAQQKYALLISAGQTTIDDDNYHSEYWYDLFLMYRMLIEDGFTHNSIFVLYGNGSDFASAHANYQPATFFPGVGQITDYPNSKTNVDNIFNWLAAGNPAEGIPQIQDGDFLFYWWMGHGDTQVGMPDCDYYADIENTGEMVLDTDFETYFARLPDCQIKALYIMTCHSAGLIDNIEGLNRMIHTAAPCDVGTQSFVYDVWHAEFSYHVANAFREQDPAGVAVASDSDADGLVSCDEINDYAHTNTTSSTTHIGDYRNIAPLLFIANAQPGAGVPHDGVYSRDYAEDNGTEPSDYMSYVWYHGPDLWVRNAQDGGTSNQGPEFGATNYVYSRIHNIDCTDMDVDVELSWCEASAWSHPASWNTIDSFTETGFAENESRVVNKPWTTVPVPGNYCLHTVLNTAGDAANADGRAFMDNNKVQINVTVVDLTLDWARNIRWNIENGLDELAMVDLVMERLKLLPNTVIELRIPPEIDFKKVVGGEVRRTEEGAVIVASPRSRRLVLQGIQLKGGAKHPAMLTVRMPKKAQPGPTMQVRVSETVKGREMGGIVFNLEKVSKSGFMRRAFREAHVFFGALGKQFEIDGANEMAGLFKKASLAIITGDGQPTKEALELFNELIPRITKGLSGKLERGDLKRFDMEMKRAGKFLRADDWEAFTNHLESGMIATKVLFFKKT
jgi:hypothetical protein